MLATLNDVLPRAKAEHYAVGLFNTHDTDMLEAAIAAAEEAHSPIIIGTAEVLLPYGDLPLIAPALVAAAKRARVPVVVHYDHGLTFEKTVASLKLGFSSVMYDASAKDYATNVAETAEMAKIAHAFGATIEGEIGHVGMAQDGDERNGRYTTVAEAVDFQTKTGVDALAVAVGNAHGVYKTKPCIQLERIGEIKAAVKCPLVMHGGSGLSDDDFHNAIARGIAKVNIHTDMVCAGMRAMYEQCDAHDRAKIVTTDYLDTRQAKVAAIKAVVARKLQLFGSVGKACALALAAIAAFAFQDVAAAEVPRVAPGPGYVCREYTPGEIKPTGFLAEFARRQAAGTTGQRMKIGYPFDQSMWEVAITNLHYADPVWRGEDRPYGKDEYKCPWVPYEQTGYMLDAMLRLSYLTDCPAIRADYLKSLEAVLANPAPDGKLGGVCPGFPGWPMTIFARSALARFQATGDKRILDAWVKHYNAFGAARRTWSGRSDYNIESMLAFNEYVGDKKVIEDAIYCFDRSYCCKLFRTEERVSMHGPTITEALKLPGILYLHTGDKQWLDLGLKSVDNLFKFHEQPDGLISANECTSGRDPGQGHEACVVADMLWTLGYYLQASPRAIDGDRMERIAYNALPGHSTKDFKRHQYMSFVNQAQVTPFSKCTHFAPRSKHMQYRHSLFFECCLGNIQRAFPAFAMRMWLKDEKTQEPIAALHGPSKLAAKFKGVDYTFEEKTEYPFDDKVTFVFHAAQPLEMTLTYRVPSWAKRADAGTFAKVRRVWKDGDTFETAFPSEVTFKTDRDWHWFTKGALTFAWPVPSKIVEENPGDDFSPLIITPAAPWNWAFDTAKIAAQKPQAVYRPNGKYPFDEPPLTLEVPAVGMQEWRVFDCNKWMPDIPLFAHPSGEKTTLKLVPYGATLARITAFPDVAPRRELVVPVAYLYDRKAYDYDPQKPLADQKFGPEVDAKFNWGFLAEDNPPQRDPDDYYDLGAEFKCYRNKLAYLVFRIWSDEEGEATFVLGAAHQYQAFLGGKEVARSIGLRDARWLAPDWFKGPVKKGYNYLTVKVATPSEWSNMRRDWGAKLQVFMEK